MIFEEKKSIVFFIFWRYLSWSVEFIFFMEGEFVIFYVDSSG